MQININEIPVICDWSKQPNIIGVSTDMECQ